MGDISRRFVHHWLKYLATSAFVCAGNDNRNAQDLLPKISRSLRRSTRLKKFSTFDSNGLGSRLHKKVTSSGKSLATNRNLPAPLLRPPGTVIVVLWNIAVT
jgi:hypothetical protein